MATPTSSLLPASRSLAPAELVERGVLREAERGERLVAWARALLMTTTFVILTLAEGIPAWTGHARTPGQGWVPLLVVPTTVTAWLWFLVLARVPYRIALSRISAAIDSVLLVGVMAVSVETQRSPVADVLSLGSLPPLLALMFVLAAAGVRQDMWTVVVGASVALVGAAAVVIRAHQFAHLPAALAFYASPTVWMSRVAIYVFTAATVSLAARNARRMARATGLAVAEQDKITQLFGRYVDPKIARDVMDHEGPDAQTLEVTVLFTDLRDFTTMSERMEPTDVLDALNDHLRAIVPVVHRHGGTVNKFIGDAIMATFGAPLRYEDHARRAVAAAQEMVREMEALNAARKRLERVELRMGIGIATGPVVVGTLGTEERVEYAVIGDTVNTASRLEGLCKEFGVGVVISANTHDAAPEGQPWRSLGEASVKGKSAKVEVWTVA